jgi:hypothetical protein
MWQGYELYLPAAFTPQSKRLSLPKDHRAAGRVNSMKNVKDPIGNRNGDLPCGSVVLQTTALLCTPFKTQWLLYVPPGLTLKNPTFCPHSVFMCFVWI